MNFLKNKLMQATASWRTSILGVGLILMGVGKMLTYLFNPGEIQIDGFADNGGTEIMAGVALLTARDNVTQSESVPK